LEAEKTTKGFLRRRIPLRSSKNLYPRKIRSKTACLSSRIDRPILISIQKWLECKKSHSSLARKIWTARAALARRRHDLGKVARHRWFKKDQMLIQRFRSTKESKLEKIQNLKDKDSSELMK